MSVKSKLKYSIKNILLNDNSGSFASQHDRNTMSMRIADDLIDLGYKLPVIHNLKQKHVIAIVEYWKQKNLSNATIKNRVSVIRHLSALMNKPQIVPSNQDLKIGARNYVSLKNRALYNPDFSKISNPHLRISLELQRVFGLRREESLKIKPHLADKGDKLELMPSWCKGGRGRFIPIRTEEQRYWLEKAKELVEKAGYSLIPQEKDYIQHRYLYDKQVERSDLRNVHGVRHAYAQQRYKELTGWEAPINGGPKSSELLPQQKKVDYHARMTLTEELGHSREQITVNYLGR